MTMDKRNKDIGMKTMIFQKFSRRMMMMVLSSIICSLSFSPVKAQEITVSVSPVQQILPPQALLYMTDPGKYFNITLVNNSAVTQNVYLAINIEQTMPADGLSINTPPKRQPQTPFTVAPGQMRQLTLVEMKGLFNHIPKNEIKTSPGLFSNFQNGAFGLLPEGQYKAQITAYKWDLAAANPIALSDPTAGYCNFTICYKAQSPEFLTPIMSNGGGLVDLSVAEIQQNNAQFTWRAPVTTCNAQATQFSYEFKIVELLPGQQPDDAINKNAAFYTVKDLVTPMVTIPPTYVNRLDKAKTYVAQVKAKQTGTGANMLNYVMIENEGKSPFRMFKLVEPKQQQNDLAVNDDKGDDKGDNKGDDNKVESDEDDTSGYGEAGSAKGDILEYDSLYVFKRPVITYPEFEEGLARKLFIEDAMEIEWRHATYTSGDGERQDTLNFTYDVELYRANVGCNKDSLFKTKALYKKSLKDDASSLSIEWEELESLEIKEGDYMVLRVNPICTNEKSIRYQEGSENVIDFAMTEHLAKSYFQCSSTVDITNHTPTTKKDSELKGSKVAIGEYTLTLDEIKSVKGKEHTYQGKGHVEWNPMGFKVMVAVKFDNLKINTDDQVYDGIAQSYQEEEEKQLSDGEVVDKLFSEWGIDNLIGDTKIPYSKEIQQQTTSGIKSIAEKLNISKYYAYIKKGQSIWNQFLKGEIDDLHLPLQLPKSINKTPVDIQIVSMKFAHNYATMDVLGEFTLPNSKYYENDILLLGAPRLCISPERVLPESGTIALLGNFTVNDPESSFDMTFKAPENVLEPTNGCFISWHADELELFDVDVDMTIPGLVKVDAKGNRTNDKPILNFHASIGGWDDWFAEASMDMFEAEDLKDWTFAPGDKIVYDHSKYRNSTGMGNLPAGYDKVKAGMASAGSKESEWQGLYIKHVGVIFPKMLSVSDTKKNFEGRLRLDAENMFFDGSGASFQFGANNVFDFNTAKVGGWGISMDEIKIDVMQNTFQKAYFNGKIQTPLEGKIGYRCDIYAQGKDANGKTDPNRSAYIFKTQQVDGLSFDFWGGAELSFDKNQTYLLVEAERIKGGDTKTKVELCVGGSLSFTIVKKAGTALSAYIPAINVSGMRIANCERWKSQYTQNQYEAPDKGKGLGVNEFFGWKNEYNIKTNSFYFSLGRWSLSVGGNNKTAYNPTNASYDDWLLAQNGHGPSPDMNEVHGGAGKTCKLGPFDLSLTDFDFNYNSSSKVASLTVGGKISLMGGTLEAGASIIFECTADIDKLSLKYKAITFGSAEFHSGFGGVSVDGKLKHTTGNDEGYEGTLTIKMPGDLFSLDIKGAYKKKTEGDTVTPWGYFEATVEGEAARFDPVVLKSITGGFYFNCTAAKQYKKDTYGGMFGMKICTSGGENLISADMKLTVVWDNAKKKLSSIVLNGKLQAAGGLVNSEANLAYKDDDKQKVIELDITVKSSVDASSVASMNKAFEAFTGKAFDMGKGIQQKLDGLVADEKNSQTEKKASNNGSSKKSTGTFTAGKLDISLNLKITKPKNGNTKWHLYIGEPDWGKRCTFTLIDFQVGSRDVGGFGAWAYLSCNAYVCLGNELPSGGLPDPPQAIQDFLYGGAKSKDVNGNTQNKKSEIQKAKENTMKALSAEADGGFMFGAGAEGDFGVNAGIVYAMGSFCVGFDVLLKHFANGAKCQGGGKMGYHDFYGMGQIYAMLKGEVGVQINLWFWKGRCSLVSVGLGALLQGGMPNPTWIYGKVKASCKLLGGLFKFNKSIEFKAGKVCMPDYGDPLDNIDMFSSAEPGVKNNSTEGYKKTVSPDLQPIFTTNYTMDHEIRLVDENLAQKQGAGYSERIYKFTLKTCEILCKGGSGTSQYNLKTETTDYENFKVLNIPFKDNSNYDLHLVGKAQEKVNGSWGDPMINGKRTAKTDEVHYYFKTSQRADDIIHNIVMSNCGSGELTGARNAEFSKPELWLNCNRDDLAGSGVNNNLKGYEFRWVLFVNGQISEWKGNEVKRWSNAECWTPSERFWKTYGNDNYRLSLIRFKKGTAESELQRRVLSQKQNKTVKTEKKSNSNQGSASSSYYKKTQGSYFGATSDPAAEMNNFFDKEEKEVKTEYTDETTNKMTTSLANSTALEMWSASVSGKNLSGLAFSYNQRTDLADIYDCERVFMTIKEINGPVKPVNDSWKINRTNRTILNAKNYKNDPYYAMAYLTKYMFLGGMKIKPYCLSNKTDNAQGGLNITLQYPEVRGWQDPIIDGAFDAVDDGKSFAYAYGKAIPWVNSTGWGIYQGDVYAASEISRMQYSYDYFELDQSIKRNPKVENTAIHRMFLQACLSDAVGVRDLLSTINSKAKWYKDRNEEIETYCNAHNNTKKKRLNGIKDSWKDQNDNYCHGWTMNGGQRSYTATFSSGGPSSVNFKTFKYSMSTQSHFVWQLAEVGIRGGDIQGVDVANYNSSSYSLRRSNASTVLNEMRTWTFDYTAYLKSIKSITYEVWVANYYDFKRRKFRRDTSSGIRKVTVYNPFSKLNSVY